MTEEQLVREAVAFAIEHGDNTSIPVGYADKNGWPDDDWLSDWGAFMADHVLKELYERGYRITRGAPPHVADLPL